MKIRKTLIILCAIAMLASALPAASAAEIDTLSEYAGKTIPVQVIEETESGMTSRIIEVAIPEGATKAEENTLVSAAAVGRTPGRMRSINATPAYTISENRVSTTLSNNNELRVGGGTPLGGSYDDIDQIVVIFEISSLSHSGSQLAFDLRSSTDPSSTTGWKSTRPYDASTTFDWRVVFVTSEFTSLSNYNSGIDVYATALYNEIIVLSSVYVCGYVN